MKQTDSPDKLVLPFADAGAKNAIPAASQIGITAGAASLTDGFPPLTRTPISAGGVPPSGLDMNGVLYLLSAVVRWACSGGGFAYDSAFATDANVDGYPKGARVMRSDGLGYWINTTDDNTTDPEAAGAVAAGWVPDFTSGATPVTMTNANVTLTPLQYGRPIVLITGALTANLNLIFPAIANQWVVVNGTTGAFTITAKPASGTGVICVQSGATYLYGDGTNISSLSAQSIPNASTTVAGIVELATDAETVAGTSTTQAITPSNLAYMTTWQKSAGQAITLGGLLTVPHGLGYRPENFTVDLVCVTADQGWSTGDIVPVGFYIFTASFPNGDGIMGWADATNIYIRYGNVGVSVMTKNTGAVDRIIPARWTATIKWKRDK